MARKVVVTVIDDLDGASAAAETVSFGIDGVGYEIDLSEANARELRAGLDKWTSFARKVGGRSRVNAPAAGRQKDAKAVREWARRNGHDVPERGRMPSAVLQAYQRAAN
ncbi:Lsr2 family protein [Nocardia zapadnayensis]|uniref:histone-like nucleoid-structuring protein Lsr2 n=1 Tax=Nocardia rhamnosiphila TaxID=426716 RepID=UPI0022457598|nr:Lsr2 family protein [Nocardia zapadnayensis]MCX0273017.1 Lsr2 family protein [Nocardia zapadnayensis]